MKGLSQQIVTLTLVVFLYGVLAPFVAVYPAAIEGAEDSALGDRVLLCTETGFQWVSLEDIQSGNVPNGEHSGPECPLCFVSAHEQKAYLAKLEIAPYPTSFAAIVRYEVPQAVVIDTQSFYSRQPRAPPIISFI